MDKTAAAYESFSKWSASKSESLLMGDVVYSKEAENNIPSSWTVGKIVSL